VRSSTASRRCAWSSFEATAEGSRLTNTTYFTSLEALEQVVAMGAIEGSRLAMSQLDAVLQDLRAYAQGKGTAPSC
jgi:hypothetical protein